MEPSAKQLNELYKRLPVDLKDVLFSEASANSIRAIGQKYSFQIEKIGILADETGLVLFGVLHPKDFIQDLSEKLGVDRETAKKIAEDVNREIFQKVRISLRKIHGITDEAEVKEVPKVPLPKPPPSPPPPLKTSDGQRKTTEGTAKPPPKIIIKENVEIPKEAPKEELKPLEIRPIKGGPLGENEPAAKKPLEIPKEPEKISPRPQLDFPPRRPQEPGHDAGLIVMPHSPEEIIKKETPKPPPGLSFLDKKGEKKLEPPHPSPKATEGTAKPPEPPKPSYDQYRERI